MDIFVALCVLAGLWNTFFTLRTLRRGYATMYGQRIDRQENPAAFWFYNVVCREGSGLLLLTFPLIVSRW